jgi:hypothetical protein
MAITSHFDSNARRILDFIDARLNTQIELTLYGRAALHLGFANAPEDFGYSHDVDVVLWSGQDEELERKSNFWEILEALNLHFEPAGLYMTHLFDEKDVILTPDWLKNRVPLDIGYLRLSLLRLGNLDLLVSKMMRNDPIDRSDTRFVVEAAGLTIHEVEEVLPTVCGPDISEIWEYTNKFADDH